MPAIKLSGVKFVLSQLSKIDPEARKTLTKEVRAAAKPLVSKARGFAPSTSPLSGWESTTGAWANRAFDSTAIQRGLGFSTGATKPNRNGFSYLAYFYNRSAAGAIYETAGRKNPGGQPWDPSSGSNKYSRSRNPNAGKQFIDSLGAVGQGQLQGRLMRRAWNQDNGQVKDAIVKSYAAVVSKFNRGAL